MHIDEQLFRSGRVAGVLFSFFTDHTKTGQDCSRHRRSTLILHRPHEDGSGLFHPVRVIDVLLSFSADRTKTDEDSCILVVSSSFSFLLHRQHEDGSGPFRSGRNVFVLLFSSSTTQRRTMTVPFWPHRLRSPFLSIDHTKTDEDRFVLIASSSISFFLCQQHKDG